MVVSVYHCTSGTGFLGTLVPSHVDDASNSDNEDVQNLTEITYQSGSTCESVYMVTLEMESSW